MKEILEETFRADYPRLTNNVYFAVDDGWYDLLRDMFAEVEYEVKSRNIVDEVSFVQIKEKFGGLRAYFEINQCADGDYEALTQVVSKYEKQSMTVCEICGAAARRSQKGGYIRTLCEACVKEQNAK